MRLTDTANRRWFRRARFRTAIVYMASVSILAGLTAFILYQVELHGSQSHVCPVVEGMEQMHASVHAFHVEQIAHTLFWSWLAMSLTAGLVGYFFAPFITRSAEEAMENLVKSADAIAHDMRTPLARLSVRAEMAVAKQENLETFAGEVMGETESLISLVNTYLEIARTERNGDEEKKTEVDLTEVVREVSDLFGPSAESLGMKFIVDVPADPIAYSCTRGKMIRVVGNLVDNAIKYSALGCTVSVRLARRMGRITLEVSDNGPGIPKEDQKHIFETFYRGKTHSGEGTGLGLALVHAIVSSYGGSISLESRPDAGTTFRVTL